MKVVVFLHAVVGLLMSSSVAVSADDAIELGETVTFRAPICHALPAGRIPTLEPDVPANDGWSLVNFCREGNTGNRPATSPDCHYNDDDSSSEDLTFSFDFYGILYEKVFINNNGNLSFEQWFSTFSAQGFPSNDFQMVAAFWADVDTGDALDTNPGALGRVWRKKIANNVFAVAWDHVGHFNEQGDLRNTFQVVISDGNEPLMGPPGTNVCFCYEDMSWTTGDASAGTEGFGGTPATVGTNFGNGIDFSQIGRYDEPGAGARGIDSLDNQTFCFSTYFDTNVAPISGNVPANNKIDLACGETLVDYVLTFAAPEFDQTVNLVVSGESNGLVVTVGDGIQTALATLNWTPATAPTEVVLTLTATDSEGGTTITILTVTSQASCATASPSSSPTASPSSSPSSSPTASPSSAPISSPSSSPSSFLTASPSSAPIAAPSSSPSSPPSVSPNANPSSSPSTSPTSSPSSSPSALPRAGPCTSCDFSTLTVYPNSALDGIVARGDVAMTNGNALLRSCGLTVTPYASMSYVTVLDSQSPVRSTRNEAFDPDLGSPSKSCGGVGRGKGGRHGQPWENCSGPLGNVLILQDPKFAYPNDDRAGGCMNFTFAYPVTNLTLGLLDIDAANNATIDVHRHGGMMDTYYPPKTGNNGYWTSDSQKNTDPAFTNFMTTRYVADVSICVSGSFAVTHLNYCPDSANIF